jgi:hypothetical protein
MTRPELDPRQKHSRPTHGRFVGARANPIEFRTWRGMLARCDDATSPFFRYYGGRGITVCDRWREGFRFFLEDMGSRPAGLSLDRINNDGNYEPGNCRWATRTEQANNKRTKILVNGVTMAVAAEAAGISRSHAYARFRKTGNV